MDKMEIPLPVFERHISQKTNPHSNLLLILGYVQNAMGSQRFYTLYKQKM